MFSWYKTKKRDNSMAFFENILNGKILVETTVKSNMKRTMVAENKHHAFTIHLTENKIYGFFNGFSRKLFSFSYLISEDKFDIVFHDESISSHSVFFLFEKIIKKARFGHSSFVNSFPNKKIVCILKEMEALDKELLSFEERYFISTFIEDELPILIQNYDQNIVEIDQVIDFVYEKIMSISKRLSESDRTLEKSLSRIYKRGNDYIK